MSLAQQPMTNGTSGATAPSDDGRIKSALARSPLGAAFAESGNPVTRELAVGLALVWDDFLRRLDATPIIQRLDRGTITLADYKSLLLNLRQQVIEGGRWIARAASSMSAPLFIIRSALITHSAAEHRDFLLVEQNYVALGGNEEDMYTQPKNIGSEAFSAFMFHQSSQPDPLDLFGAMFIIEGLGTARAGRWAARLKEVLHLEDKQVSFLAYHGENDDSHYEKLRMILSSPFITKEVATTIVKTAKVVGRLYNLQLEEIDNL